MEEKNYETYFVNASNIQLIKGRTSGELFYRLILRDKSKDNSYLYIYIPKYVYDYENSHRGYLLERDDEKKGGD